MTRALRWPAAIVLSGLVLDVAVVVDAAQAVRLVAALWFLLVCTGMSFVPLLGLRGLDAELALGIALSLAIDTFVTTAALVAGGFSMAAGLVVLQLLCLVGCAAQVRRWAAGRPAFSLRLYS